MTNDDMGEMIGKVDLDGMPSQAVVDEWMAEQRGHAGRAGSQELRPLGPSARRAGRAGTSRPGRASRPP